MSSDHSDSSVEETSAPNQEEVTQAEATTPEKPARPPKTRNSLDGIGSSGSILSIGSAGSILSIGSAGSILSIGSSGSILSVGSSGSVLSIGSIGSVLSLVSVGSVLSIASFASFASLLSAFSVKSMGRFRAINNQPNPVAAKKLSEVISALSLPEPLKVNK